MGDLERPKCYADFRSISWVTRDLEGNRVKPLWPYFQQERDVRLLKERHPIHVDSCWNGVAAFDARWFIDDQPPALPRKITPSKEEKRDMIQTSPAAISLPLRFRSSRLCLSSECLLISLDMHRSLNPQRPLVFMNPVVTVGEYSRSVRTDILILFSI